MAERFRILACLIIGLALVPCLAFGQITTATVSGTVKDAQGNIVPGVTVVLISQTRGVQAAETTTDATGSFVFPNTAADTYTVQASLQGFKTLKVSGITASPGDRLALPPMTIEVGTVAETIVVTGETPLIQTASGERSFTVPTTSVENLPIQSRNFLNLALLTPGVSTVTGGAGIGRIGGGGYTNVMMDGISAMDTGNNGQMLAMNTDAVAEVKILTSAYQAEYGRSSGIQVLSVTKGGTNQFRGSVYDVERNSAWNKNSWYNRQVGNAKTVSKDRDFGYTVGGPIGKPGANNKLFFFFSQEFRPRTGGNVEQNFRVPTALERKGDFSQSRDNNGNLYPYIKDPLSPYACSSTNTTGCFQDGGVLGKIPASRLYAPGLAILNLYSVQPNVTQTAGMSYNVHQFSPVIKTLSYQMSTRVDYQVSSNLRVAFKYNGMNQNSGLRDQFGCMGCNQNNAGYAISGLTDSKGNQKPWIHTLSASANVNLGSRTFVEAIWGFTQNWYEWVSTASASNRQTAGLSAIPDIYSSARTVDPSYFTYAALGSITAPFFVNGKLELPQQAQFGTRAGSYVGLPSYAGWLNTNKTWDFGASLTHVRGRHTIKAGVSLNHSFKAQNMTSGAAPMGVINYGEDTNNPYDTSYGFANAALGIFSSYSQASKFVESGMVYLGVEPYIQDNWKVNDRLTLDYGLRFVHLQPEHDKYGQASQFFPDQWSAANAPTLYTAGCPGGSYPCPYTRQAMNPTTNQLMGAGTAGLIGQAIPGTGITTNGIKKQGDGISDYNFEYPFLKVAPRVGFAYFLKPGGKWILRGGFGLFYDRVEGNWTMNQSANPPVAESTTMYYGQLQSLGGGASAKGVPSMLVYRYHNDNLPASAQWNIGTQMELPAKFVLDLSYVGQHAYDTLGMVWGVNATNLNMVDLGAAYLAGNQDKSLATSTVPGATANTSNLLRPYKGFSTISQAAQDFWRTYHSLQSSLQRRFANGFSAGLVWTWALSDKGNYGVFQRIQHSGTTASLRSDQKDFEKMMEDQGTPKHTIRGNFVWDLPDMHASSGGGKAVGYLVNDWQLSGLWSFSTGAGYTPGFYYYMNGSNQNLTGSPDYAARIKIVGDTGSGCSSDQYRQFNAVAFTGPGYYSNGMESGQNYLRGCSTSVWDLAFSRMIRAGGRRNFQVRAEVYNILNSQTFTSRNSTVALLSPTTPTVMNSQFLSDGSLDSSRAKPNNAGFGAATGTLTPLNVQIQLRFSF